MRGLLIGFPNAMAINAALLCVLQAVAVSIAAVQRGIRLPYAPPNCNMLMMLTLMTMIGYSVVALVIYYKSYGKYSQFADTFGCLSNTIVLALAIAIALMAYFSYR